MGLLSKVFGGDDVSKGYKRGINAQKQMYETARGDLAPYRDFGGSYLSGLRDFMSRGRPTGESVRQTPGYQFRMDEGTRALDNSAVARGGLLSGNHLRDILSYGQDYASNEYDKELVRNENDFSRLMQMVNLGYGAAGGSAGIAQNSGNALANLYVGKGQAEADIAQFPWKLGASIYGMKQGGKAG